MIANIRVAEHVHYDAKSLSDVALDLYDIGLALVPAPSDDGKSVCGAVAGFHKWRRRLPRSETKAIFERHSGACIAILPYLCRPRLVVVDCDDEAALAIALQRYGPTTLKGRLRSLCAQGSDGAALR